jgi:hypothetical protein
VSSGFSSSPSSFSLASSGNNTPAKSSTPLSTKSSTSTKKTPFSCTSSPPVSFLSFPSFSKVNFYWFSSATTQRAFLALPFPRLRRLLFSGQHLIILYEKTLTGGLLHQRRPCIKHWSDFQRVESYCAKRSQKRTIAVNQHQPAERAQAVRYLHQSRLEKKIQWSNKC